MSLLYHKKTPCFKGAEAWYMTKILLERNRLQTRCSRLSYDENVSVIEPAEVKLMEIVNVMFSPHIQQFIPALRFPNGYDPACTVALGERNGKFTVLDHKCLKKGDVHSTGGGEVHFPFIGVGPIVKYNIFFVEPAVEMERVKVKVDIGLYGGAGQGIGNLFFAQHLNELLNSTYKMQAIWIVPTNLAIQFFFML